VGQHRAICAGLVRIAERALQMKIVSQRREPVKSVYNRCRFDVKKEIPGEPEIEESHNIVVAVRPMRS
jgi:hypothetical protein